MTPKILQSQPLSRSAWVCLLLLLFAALSFPAQAQNATGLCGSFFAPDGNHAAHAPGNGDIVDQFGRTYRWQDLKVERPAASAQARNAGCQTGSFDLCFTGFDADEEATICEVFNYLSTIVAVGSSGSVPLIQVVKEGFDNQGTPDNTTLGVGIVYWQLECGTINPLMFNVMNTNLGENFSEDFASAVIRINGNINWHTLADGALPSPPTSVFDLYSVTLHEALHTLGFASRLGENTVNSSPTIFSRWDRFLWSSALPGPVLTPALDPQPGCCDQLEFNPAFNVPPSSNFPPGLLNGCQSQVFFAEGSNLLAQVNGNYSGPPSPGLINNTFSHLDRCGSLGSQYVMFAGLAGGESRRVLDPSEIAILSALGYASPGATTQPCLVVALDDVLDVVQGAPSITLSPTSQNNHFIVNDLAPPGSTITVDVNCGNAYENGLVFPTSQGTFIVRPSWSTVTPGEYTMCYTLTGCNGQCDDGVLVINVLPNIPPLPECPPADACSGDPVWCHGDFDEMVPVMHFAQGQIGVQDCFGNSPDLVLDLSNGNRAIRFWEEGFVIPLNPGISPGCAIEVNFDGAGNFGAGVTLSVGEAPPCDNLGAPTCPGAPNNAYQCINTTIFPAVPGPAFFNTNCNDPLVQNWVPNCNHGGTFPVTNGPLVFSSYTTNLITNTSTETWNYLYISGFGLPSWKYVDNLEVLAHCENEVELTSTATLPDEVCPGETSIVEVEICMTGTNATPTDVQVNLTLPTIPGLNIAPGSAFAGGQAVLTGMAPGDCRTIAVEIEVGYNIAPGTVINVGLGMEGTNICISPNSLWGYDINVKDCSESCSAEWSIVCFEESNYFCVVNQFGGSDYLLWADPQFPNNPNGHCQPLTGLTQGQPLSFNIFVFDEGLALCTLTVNTTLPCDPEMFGGGGGGGTDGRMNGQFGAEVSLEVYPNPAANQLTVEFNSEHQGLGQLRLFDLSGRQVMEQAISLEQGKNQKQLALGQLPAGLYALSLIVPGQNRRSGVKMIRIDR